MNSDSRFSSDEVTFNLTKEDNETLKELEELVNSGILNKEEMEEKKRIILDPYIKEYQKSKQKNDNNKYLAEEKLVEKTIKLSDKLIPVDYNYKVCNVCKKSEETQEVNIFKKCGQCQKVFYCGRDCQVKDWKEHDHGKVCKK